MLIAQDIAILRKTVVPSFFQREVIVRVLSEDSTAAAANATVVYAMETALRDSDEALAQAAGVCVEHTNTELRRQCIMRLTGTTSTSTTDTTSMSGSGGARAVKSMYRMTGKGAPTTSCSYAASILASPVAVLVRAVRLPYPSASSLVESSLISIVNDTAKKYRNRLSFLFRAMTAH